MLYIEGLVKDCSNSIDNALELLQCCPKPSIYFTCPKFDSEVKCCLRNVLHFGHYNDVIAGIIASQITSLMIFLLNCLFRRRSKKISKLRVTGLCVGNSPGPVNSQHKWPVMRKMFPFDDVIMPSHIVRTTSLQVPWTEVKHICAISKA